MTSIPVESLKAGRILAADVKNTHGQLLIKKGMEVSDKHLRVLKSWGVVEVQVEGDPREAVEECAAEQFSFEILEQARVQVLGRMRHNSLDHAAIDELVRLAVQRCARQLVERPCAPTSPQPES